MWREEAGVEDETTLRPGLSLTLPVGVRFQFRNDGAALLQIVAVTMPPWPGAGEAIVTNGKWAATV